MKTIFVYALIALSGISLLKGQSNLIGPGISLEMDGADANYVNLGDVYNTINFPLTFEAWVKPSGYVTPFNGLFSSDSKNTGNYYGFYVRFTGTGTLSFEIGDGIGAGVSHRRGKVTTSIVPLNTWTHIAIIATSATDIQFYFNGILQTAVNSDGTSGVTSIVHNTNPAEIGRFATMFDTNNFEGQMDDIRLWDTTRSETDVRSNMCHKLIGTESGLVGYWKIDESYVSLDVNDITTPAENGTISGVVNKITSSAPIGDVSKNEYHTDWSGVTLSLTAPGGDKMKISKILNTPAGVHFYRVNSAPYFDGNLNEFTDYYFGVFTINGASPAKYTETYTYSMSNGVVTIDNEPNAHLYVKSNAAAFNWNDIGATLNTVNDKLTKNNITSMREFIFNVVDQAQPRIENESSKFFVYPNPAENAIIVSNIAGCDQIIITNITGEVVFQQSSIKNLEALAINVTNLNAGIYLIHVLEQGKSSTSKIVIEK